MQALVRTFFGAATFPVKHWRDVANKFLFHGFLNGIWWLWNLAFGLQKVELTHETDEIDVESMSKVPRIYVSWHARFLAGAGLLEYTKTLYAVSMPRQGWGHEGLFQTNLRRGFFAAMDRRGFRFIEQQHRRLPGQTVDEIVVRLQEGAKVVMTGDGPKGGAFIAQLGAILAASKTGVELVPYSFSSSRKIRINPFWDNCMVPVPFGTFHLRLGKPMRLEKDMSPEALEQARQELATSLNRVTLATDDLAGIRREYRLRLPETALRNTK